MKKSTQKKPKNQTGFVTWHRESIYGPIWPMGCIDDKNSNINFHDLLGKKTKIVITVTD